MATLMQRFLGSVPMFSFATAYGLLLAFVIFF